MRFRGYSRALELAVEREHSRKEGDYPQADAYRRELEAMRVRLDDATHMFTTEQGHRGTYSLRDGVGFEEVQLMCLDREEARRESDYQESDHIRSQLVQMGVEIDDRAHIFVMPGGTTGSYDLRNFEHEAPPAARYDGARYASEPSERRHNGWDRPPPERPQRGVHERGPPPDFRDRPPQGFQDRPPPRDFRNGPPGDPRQKPPGGFRERPPEDFRRAGDRPPPGFQERRSAQEAPPTRRAPQSREEDGRRSRQQGAPPPPPPPPPFGAGGGEGDRFQGYLEALQLAREREELRKARDYQGSDRLRVDLSQRGAVLNDNAHIFSLNGWEGSYDLRDGIGFREVQFVALEREEARREKDYGRGDALRQWLNENRVEIDDKSHIFTMADGTVGSYDLYNWSPAPLRGSEPPAKRHRRD